MLRIRGSKWSFLALLVCLSAATRRADFWALRSHLRPHSSGSERGEALQEKSAHRANNTEPTECRLLPNTNRQSERAPDQALSLSAHCRAFCHFVCFIYFLFFHLFVSQKLLCLQFQSPNMQASDEKGSVKYNRLQ